MKVSRRQFLAGLHGAPVVVALQPTPEAPDFVASDPARVGRTGRSQLVEFFHPL